MIVFKQKKENRYLITNYKVMFSSLVNQPNLQRTKNTSFVIQKVLEILRLRKKSSIHFLIRDPELRLQSFFHNKFRQHIDKTKFNDWEDCQQLFFEFLGIKRSDNSSIIKARILLFTYQDFITTLKDHYLKDRHLAPQNNMFNLSILGIPMPFNNKPDMVYLMEKNEDLERMGKIFKLNLSVKKNVSHKKSEQFLLTNELLTTIHDIYKEDYRLYSQSQ